MAYVRDPILILKDARRAIIQTLLVCQIYANFCLSLFFHLHVLWHGRPVKIPLRMNISLVCRVQSGNVLSLKDIQDRAYCCNN